MNSLRAIVALLGVFIVAPIWYYILYQLLKATDASELTWFLFWVYMPVAIFVHAVSKLLEK